MNYTEGIQLGLGLYSGSTEVSEKLADTVDLSGMRWSSFPRREGAWIMYSRYWTETYFVPGTIWKCKLLGYKPDDDLWCAMLEWEEREEIPEATRPSTRITKHPLKVFSRHRKWMDKEERQYVVHQPTVIRDMRLPMWAKACEGRDMLTIPPFDWVAEYGTLVGERTMVENENVRIISNSGRRYCDGLSSSSARSQSSSSQARPVPARQDLFHPPRDGRLLHR